MARPLSNEDIREKYLTTNEERYALLEKYRSGHLNDIEQQALWVMVSDLVYSRSRRHYKRKQSYGRRIEGRARNWYEIPNNFDSQKTRENYEAHVDRIQMFLRFIQENKQKSVQLLITEWTKRYSWFEMVRDLENRGIGSSDSLTLTERVNLSSTRNLIEVKKMIRSYQLHNPNAVLKAKEIVSHWVRLHPEREYTPQKVKNLLLRVYTYLQAVDTANADTFTDLGLEGL